MWSALTRPRRRRARLVTSAAPPFTSRRRRSCASVAGASTVDHALGASRCAARRKGEPTARDGRPAEEKRTGEHARELAGREQSAGETSEHQPRRAAAPQRRSASRSGGRQAAAASGKRQRQAASGKRQRQAAAASGERQRRAASGERHRQSTRYTLLGEQLDGVLDRSGHLGGSRVSIVLVLRERTSRSRRRARAAARDRAAAARALRCLLDRARSRRSSWNGGTPISSSYRITPIA